MSKEECYNCHKFGHFAGDCRQTKKKLSEGFKALLQKQKKKKKTKSNKDGEPRIEYYLISAFTSSFTDCATSWLVDSGASRHMTGNR